jgi:hypothetical protein
MENDFDYHLEKAIQSLLDKNKANLGEDKNLARAFVRKNIWTLVNYRLPKIVEKLIP